MAEAHQFDPFENDEEVELDAEELRIVDERCREIDEGRARMLTSEEAREHFSPMAFKLTYADKALIDLENIFEWSRKHHPDTTERFGEELFNHLELLTSFPHLARVRGNVQKCGCFLILRCSYLIEILSFRHAQRRRLRF
jgi:plasmid stabilization system protein ParE